MKSKITLKQILIIIILAEFVFFLMFVFNFKLKSQTETSSVSLTANTNAYYELGETNSQLPIRLKIPKINVDANIEQVGIASDGSMGVPKGPSETAWYKFGPRPGEIGSAVIDGHSGYKNNRPAVFDNLYKLQKGDKIYVEDATGAIVTFVVRESRTYNPKADATDVFNSNDGLSHLNLITCTGIWNKIWKSHSSRLIVFADKEI